MLSVLMLVGCTTQVRLRDGRTIRADDVVQVSPRSLQVSTEREIRIVNLADVDRVRLRGTGLAIAGTVLLSFSSAVALASGVAASRCSDHSGDFLDFCGLGAAIIGAPIAVLLGTGGIALAIAGGERRRRARRRWHPSLGPTARGGDGRLSLEF